VNSVSQGDIKRLLHAIKKNSITSLVTQTLTQETYLSELFLEIYRRDLVLAHTPKQKALLKLEFIEQSYAFLLLIQTFKINRQNLQVGSLILAKFRTKYIQDTFKSLNSVTEELTNDEELLSHLSAVELNRLRMIDARRKDLNEVTLNKTF
jgi:hypothetical protein